MASGAASNSVAVSATPRLLAWASALVVPLVLGPAWWMLWSTWGSADLPPICTFAGLLLALLVVTCGYTDLRWRRIPNWATYSAVLWGLAINVYASASGNFPPLLGAVGLQQSLGGFVILFVLMLIVFSFTGGGAGDVKLMAALGVLLGVDLGINAVAFSFVIAGATILIWSIIRHGPLRLVTAFGRSAGRILIPLWVDGPSEEDHRLLKSKVPLGPFFAAGTLLVLFDARLDHWLASIGLG